jgi:hypothetical protein
LKDLGIEEGWNDGMLEKQDLEWWKIGMLECWMD